MRARTLPSRMDNTGTDRAHNARAGVKQARQERARHALK
jgi:hypothetical protein